MTGLSSGAGRHAAALRLLAACLEPCTSGTLAGGHRASEGLLHPGDRASADLLTLVASLLKDTCMTGAAISSTSSARGTTGISSASLTSSLQQMAHSPSAPCSALTLSSSTPAPAASQAWWSDGPGAGTISGAGAGSGGAVAWITSGRRAGAGRGSSRGRGGADGLCLLRSMSGGGGAERLWGSSSMSTRGMCSAPAAGTRTSHRAAQLQAATQRQRQPYQQRQEQHSWQAAHITAAARTELHAEHAPRQTPRRLFDSSRGGLSPGQPSTQPPVHALAAEVQLPSSEHPLTQQTQQPAHALGLKVQQPPGSVQLDRLIPHHHLGIHEAVGSPTAAAAAAVQQVAPPTTAPACSSSLVATDDPRESAPCLPAVPTPALPVSLAPVPPTGSPLLAAVSATYMELVKAVVDAREPAALAAVLDTAVAHSNLKGQFDFQLRLAALVLSRACEVATWEQDARAAWQRRQCWLHGVPEFHNRSSSSSSRNMAKGLHSRAANLSRDKNGGRDGVSSLGALQGHLRWHSAAAAAVGALQHCIAEAVAAGSPPPVLPLRRAADLLYWVAAIQSKAEAGVEGVAGTASANEAGAGSRVRAGSEAGAGTGAGNQVGLTGAHISNSHSSHVDIWAPQPLLDQLVIDSIAQELQKLKDDREQFLLSDASELHPPPLPQRLSAKAAPASQPQRSQQPTLQARRPAGPGAAAQAREGAGPQGASQEVGLPTEAAEPRGAGQGEEVGAQIAARRPRAGAEDKTAQHMADIRALGLSRQAGLESASVSVEQLQQQLKQQLELLQQQAAQGFWLGFQAGMRKGAAAAARSGQVEQASQHPPQQRQHPPQRKGHANLAADDDDIDAAAVGHIGHERQGADWLLERYRSVPPSRSTSPKKWEGVTGVEQQGRQGTSKAMGGRHSSLAQAWDQLPTSPSRVSSATATGWQGSPRGGGADPAPCGAPAVQPPSNRWAPLPTSSQSWPARTLMNLAFICHSLERLPPSSPSTWDQLASAMIWLLDNRDVADSRCGLHLACIAGAFATRHERQHSIHVVSPVLDVGAAGQPPPQLLQMGLFLSALEDTALKQLRATSGGAKWRARGASGAEAATVPGAVLLTDAAQIALALARMGYYSGRSSPAVTPQVAGTTESGKGPPMSSWRTAQGLGQEQLRQREQRGTAEAQTLRDSARLVMEPVQARGQGPRREVRVSGAGTGSSTAAAGPSQTDAAAKAAAAVVERSKVRLSALRRQAKHERHAVAQPQEATPRQTEGRPSLLAHLCGVIAVKPPSCIHPVALCDTIRALAAAGDQVWLERMLRRLNNEDLGGWSMQHLVMLSGAINTPVASPTARHGHLPATAGTTAAAASTDASATSSTAASDAPPPPSKLATDTSASPTSAACPPLSRAHAELSDRLHSLFRLRLRPVYHSAVADLVQRARDAGASAQLMHAFAAHAEERAHLYSARSLLSTVSVVLPILEQGHNMCAEREAGPDGQRCAAPGNESAVVNIASERPSGEAHASAASRVRTAVGVGDVGPAEAELHPAQHLLHRAVRRASTLVWQLHEQGWQRPQDSQARGHRQRQEAREEQDEADRELHALGQLLRLLQGYAETLMPYDARRLWETCERFEQLQAAPDAARLP